MKNVFILGCGLLGSSLVRRISKKKLAKEILIYEKSRSNITKIKKLRLPGTIIKSLKDGVNNTDLIIFCTPMSEYKGLILKINSFISPKTLITDIGSSVSLTGVVLTLEQDDSNKALPKVINNIFPRLVNLQFQ